MQKTSFFVKLVKAGTVAVLAFTFISPAFAVAVATVRPTRANIQATLAQERQQYRNQLCTSTQATIQTRLQLKEQTMAQFTQRFNNFKQKISDLIEAVSLKYPTVDLSKIEADMLTLQTMYNVANQASQEAYSAYSSINFENCLNGTGEFKNQLTQAKNKAANAFQAHQAYWNFVKNTIKPDLQAIKTEIASISTTD